MAAAERRLKAEMGLDCQLEEFGSFIYQADVGDGLVGNEFDHMLLGRSNLDPSLNMEEEASWKLVRFAALGTELNNRPEDFTYWFRLIVDTQLHKFPPLSDGATAVSSLG